jgi:hypothetical protein
MSVTGRRHYCPAGRYYPHTNGDGAPKRKKCAYCGSRIEVQEGVYGVFVWRGDGRYRRENAERLFAREAKADAYIAIDPRFVVRWLIAD